MVRLVLVLGDQLSPRVAALRAADKSRDVVVMAEVAGEATYVRHHPKKIALVLAAMRNFAKELVAQGWSVAYTPLDDPNSTGSIVGELERRAAEYGAKEVLCTRPGEWRLITSLTHSQLDTTVLEDDRFIASHAEFDCWAKGRKQLRMEYFYREMRRKTGLLMDGDTPEGGKWNYDHDNRKPPRADLFAPAPKAFPLCPTTSEVLDLVEARFPDHFGTLRPFAWATTADQAEQALDHFIETALPRFGDFQDAMLTDNRFLYHAVISAYLNIGLLDPLQICRKVEAAYSAGHAPLNAVEGFIRQIIGWREYVRGIYFREGPDYVTRNALDHHRGLPDMFWGAETQMNCISHVVLQTRDTAYAHHIQRLMVTGNFALLAGLNPTEVHEWYLSVYMDAFEWVEAPNTVGMSQFADGGIVASKPYVSSGQYINRMSDYCGQCAYSVKDRSGDRACPFNLLYWHFLNRHRARFAANPRMGRIYSTWDRMEDTHKTRVLDQADSFLARMDRGETV